MASYLDQLDDIEDAVPKRKVARTDLTTYARYNFDTRSEIELPIHASREKIVEAVRENRVIILQGDTGCGKTTQVNRRGPTWGQWLWIFRFLWQQVPQFILEDCYQRMEFCNIICTQPRRIAAISIAKRVCQERKWNLGEVVSYQVRFLGINQANGGGWTEGVSISFLLLWKLANWQKSASLAKL